ncbi:MAG: glycosyltransferase [Tessaracoccus sp.]|uniref:glycosyltransferase n=1 Tax=Tessaracoccus sp. TaxID=1971211 RepID=UPI001EC0DA94|nr:glycosyltransferase [Tessaracoccus sp.]MBK7822462.1 glycosyltransferase [Tessaracoccus sp.]
MRVAFICLHTSPGERAGTADAGGMNVLIRALGRALRAKGVDVEFFTRRSSPSLPDSEVLDDGTLIHYVSAGPATPLPKGEIDQHIDEFRAGLGSLDGFDVVHSHHWMSGVAALPLARAAGIPHLMTFHSVAAHPNSSLRDGEPPESPARLAGEITCATESDLVITVSRHEAAVVIGRCQADPERVLVVRPGVDIELFRPAAPGEAWAPDGVRPGYVLFAARLQPLKAPDLAIAAVAGLPEGGRPDLVLVGQAPADLAGYEADLHSLAASKGTRVAFLPGQDREGLARLLRHASVVLVPSYSETFGLIALEASASGVPVLAAAAGGLTEAICNTHTGLLVPTHEPSDWSEALGSLLGDPGRRAEMGVTGRRRAEEMTWARAAEQTLAAYRKAVAAGRVIAVLHAHPDDETLASGALIAHWTDEGIEVTVLTATRGEMGGVVPGPLSALEGTPELEIRREAELAGALAELGVRRHAYLGAAPARAGGEPRRYRDSGMAWVTPTVAGPAEDSAPDAFCKADVAEAVADTVAFLRATGASLVVSYDDDGGYGHPDHVRMHEVAKAAAEELGLPFAALTAHRELATRWYDLEDSLPRVAAALRHHRTQLTVHDDGATITHSGGQTEPILTSTGLITAG